MDNPVLEQSSRISQPNKKYNVSSERLLTDVLWWLYMLFSHRYRSPVMV